jgi:hypothetical protein
MAKKERREGPLPTAGFVAPPPVVRPHKPGDKGSKFYLPTPPSKRESQVMALIGSKAVVILMGCLLGAMFVIVLVLLVARV